jgi:hypothetical protein
MEKYIEYFENLWVSFSKNEVEKQQHVAAQKIQTAYRGHKGKGNRY